MSAPITGDVLSPTSVSVTKDTLATPVLTARRPIVDPFVPMIAMEGEGVLRLDNVNVTSATQQKTVLFVLVPTVLLVVGLLVAQAMVSANPTASVSVTWTTGAPGATSQTAL